MVPGDFLLGEVSWFRLPTGMARNQLHRSDWQPEMFPCSFFSSQRRQLRFKSWGLSLAKKTYRCPVFKLGHPPVSTVLDGCAMRYVFHWDMMYKRIWRKIEVVTSDWNQVILSISDSDFARRSRHLLQSLRRLDLLLASWQFSPLVLEIFVLHGFQSWT